MSTDPSPSRPASGTTGSFSGWRILFTGSLVLGVFLMLLVIAAAASRWFVGKAMPDTAATIHRYKTTMVSLTPEWHQPADLPPADVTAFHKRFGRIMENFRKRHQSVVFAGDDYKEWAQEAGLPGSDGVSGHERTSVTAALAELQLIIDETSAGVSLAGYTLESDLALIPVNFLEVQTFAKLMATVASVLASRGDCRAAVETAMLPLRLVKRPEQSYPITHLIAIAVSNISVKALADVCDTCSQTLDMENVLTTLNELRDDVFPGEISRWYNEPLMALRYAAAYGYPVRLAPQTEAEIITQYQRLGADYYRWIIDKFPASDPKVAAARESMGIYKAGGTADVRFLKWLHLSGTPTDFQRTLTWAATGYEAELLRHAMVGEMNFVEAQTRAYVGLALYDMLRLDLAAKANKEISPAGNPSENLAGSTPRDLFNTGGGFLATEAVPRYSIGPDRLDDKARVMYDPTNGTISGGDVWLE